MQKADDSVAAEEHGSAVSTRVAADRAVGDVNSGVRD